MAVHERFHLYHSTAWAVWQVVGTLAGAAVLIAFYFSTGLSGRRRPSGAHGFLGIVTGFTVLVFVAAYLWL